MSLPFSQIAPSRSSSGREGLLTGNSEYARNRSTILPRSPRLVCEAKVAGGVPQLCYAGLIRITRESAMSPRLPLAFALVLFVASSAPAQPSLDPELAGPCLWRIVVKAEPHPLLTPSFRGHIRRD